MSVVRKDWVSVIIPTYNRAKTLPDAIAACLDQSYEFVEIIVIDDGSTDETIGILKTFKNSHPDKFNYFCQKHAGACVARNKGLEVASGEFIQFLDSDDLILNDKLSIQVEALKNSVFPVAVCDFALTGSKPQYPFINKYFNSGNLKQVLASFGSVSISTPLIRTNSLPKDLLWDSRVTRNQDMNFMFRYFLTIKGWEYTPGFYVYWVQHEGEQISDSCYQGPQYDLLFSSAYNYWKKNKPRLPIENNWMMRNYAITLAPQLSLRLRILAALTALGRPFNTLRVIRAILIIVRTPKHYFLKKKNALSTNTIKTNS